MKTKRFTKIIAAWLICTGLSLGIYVTPVLGTTTDTTDVAIYAFPSEPVVDGIIEEGWNDNEFQLIDKVSEEYSVEMELSEDDFLPKFKMSWYGNRLYFLMVVYDNYLYNVNDYAHQNDGFSLNLDLGYEMNHELDDNDHNLVMGWGKPESSFIWTFVEEFQDTNIYDLIDYAEVIDEINGIFVAELSFDASVLNMPQPLAEGVVFGLEIETIDYDGHDNPETFGRDQTAFWHSDTAISWNDRSVVGAVGLGSVGLLPAKSQPDVINQVSQNELVIYPQPSRDQITIKADDKISKVVIYTMLGEQVVSRNTESASPSIDISALSEGCYLISAFTDTGLYCTKQLIVQ